MHIVRRFPLSLSKFVLGQEFVVSLDIDTDKPLQLQLYTNVNHAKDTIDLTNSGRTYECRIPLTTTGFFTWKVRYRYQEDESWKWLRDESGEKIKGRIQVDPAWIEDAIVYNVFVRFFKGEVASSGKQINPGDGGTFDDVKAHLDELVEMGINTLYFNPIHLIGELYRKYNMFDQLPAYLQPGSPYSIKDFKSIDPELTYDKDSKKHLMADPAQEFRELIEAAHQRGMYVIMDMVFNHTAHDFVFQRIRPEWYFYKENITSVDEPFLYPEDIAQGKPWGDPKHTMAPYDHGIWWEDAAQLNWEYMNPPGPNQPPPNTSLQEMWEYFKSIPKYWIRHFGVDGFRCDIAYRVPPEFWKACIAEAREESQQQQNNLAHDVIFIAEAFTNNLAELQEAGFSAVYGDYSNKLARPVDLKGYLDYMYNLSGNHFPYGSKWFIFPECHDFSRTAQKILGDQAGEDLHTTLLANQSRWLITATLPGMPLIFNGFEKLEWQPINLFSYGAVDWEKDQDLREFISKINHIRRNESALKKGSYTYLETNQGLHENTQLYCFIREYEGQRIIVVSNMDVHRSAGPALIYLPAEFSGSYQLTDLLTDETFKRSGTQLLVELPPGEAHVFKVTLE